MKKLIFLILIVFSIGVHASAYDSLIGTLSTNLSDTDRVNNLNKCAWIVRYNNPDTSIIMSEQAMAIAEEMNWELAMSKSYYELGIFFFLKSNYPVAMDYYLKALRIDERLGREASIANLNATIGIIHGEQGDYDKSLAYTKKALKLHGKLDKQKGVSIDLANIGNIFEQLGQPDSALTYYNKSLATDMKLGYHMGATTTYDNLGSIYHKKGDLQKAMKYILLAQRMADSLEFDQARTHVRSNMVTVYLSMKAYAKADSVSQLVLKMAKDISSVKILSNTYLDIARIKDSLGLDQEAFDAYKNHIVYRDSIENDDNIKRQTRSEMAYDYDKASLIKEQEKMEEARLNREEVARRDRLQYSIIFICLLVVFGSVAGLGFIRVSPGVAEGLIFFSFLILFEFILVLADPTIEEYSGGAPGYKLLFNAVLAGLIFPLHAFFEKLLKSRLIKRE